MSEPEGKRRRGPPPGVLRDAPYYPSRVLEIVRMRAGGMKLQEIASVFGMTPAGVSHICQRWGRWAETQKADAT